MSNIVIGFSRPPAKFPPPIFAWAIMLFGWRNFSHVYVRFHSDFFKRDLVYQASGLRVNFIGFPMFLSQEIVVKEFTVPVSDETQQAVIQFMIDNVGAPYAFWAAIGTVAVKIAAVFGKKIKNPISQQGHFCSEITALIAKDFLGGKLTTEDVKRMTPADDYKFFESMFGGQA